MVSSNAAASITPMFVEDANPVSVSAGDDNMPFAFVDWAALQSDVVSEAGVTFKVTRDGTTGENAGDAAYVTCGPFRCTEGTDMMAMAPEITIDDSAVCAAWDPDVSLQVGFVDNNKMNAVAAATPDALSTIAYRPEVATDTANSRPNDGVDVGWVISSTTAMTVTHHFNGVANGQNFSTSGLDASKGTSQALAMTNLSNDNRAATSDSATAARVDDTDFKGALFLGDAVGAGATDDVDPCEDARYTDPRSGLHKPDSCFRAVSAGSTTSGTDYYGGYSIELTAKDSGVSWGKVVWSSDTNPFKGLKCESMTFMATDVAEVDVCDLFEDDVDAAMAAGWGGSRGTSVSFIGGDSSTSLPASAARAALADSTGTVQQHLVTLQITQPTASSQRFAALYHSDNDGSAKDPAAHDLYATARNPLQIALLDKDGDPKYGDFGKVDFVGAADGTDADTLRDFGENGAAENAAGGESACSHADGEGCDGMLEEMITVKFDAGIALGCSTTRDVMITCEWDANGEKNGYRADDHHSAVTQDDTATTANENNFAGFFSGPPSGTARAAGTISAFVSCKVSGS